MKKLKTAVFIDNANWFYPQRELGWKISYQKLKDYLNQKYEVAEIIVYAGTPLDVKDLSNFNKFCGVIEKCGIEIKTKPLKKIWVNRKKRIYEYKCNFDVEIALDIARKIKTVDLIIIGSGDSDFLEAKNYVLQSNKKFMVLCFEKGVSWEMRKCYHVFLESIKDVLERK